MHITQIESQNQTINSEKLGIFKSYFSIFKIGSMLNKSGITKTKGASPLEQFTIVFNLAFIGKNFFEGVVRNKKIAVGKDAEYNFLNSPTYNWRRFTLLLCSQIYFLIKNFLDDSSEEVLIFDDVDQRSIGDLFRACYEELANITFVNALKRIMQIATAMLRKIHNLPEMVINSILDLIMGEAIVYFGLKDNQTPQLKRI